MLQKIIQIGNSSGLVIPNELKRQAGLQKGSEVTLSLNQNNDIVVSKKGSVKKSEVTPEFLDWLKGFNKKYGSALKELAGK